MYTFPYIVCCLYVKNDEPLFIGFMGGFIFVEVRVALHETGLCCALYMYVFLTFFSRKQFAYDC